MKPIFKISLLAATIFLVVGCNKESEADTHKSVEPAKVEQTTSAATATTPVTTPAATSAATSAATPEFKTEDQKSAYAIGASLAQYLSANLDQQKELGLNLNRKYVLEGVEDVFAGKSRMTQEQTQQALQSLDQRVAKIVEQKAKTEAEKNIKVGEEFRTKFSKEAGVVTTKSGLMYKVEKEGTGAKPTATDTVEVQYKGMLTDGTVFDSSYKRNQPATFPLNQVIPGWTEGVQLMPVGSKFEFVIPPQLAYGAQANPSIPANSTLIFQVELLSIKGGKHAQQPVAEATKAITETKAQ